MTTAEIIKDNIKNRRVVGRGVKRLTHDEWFKQFKPIKPKGISEDELELDGYGFVNMGQEEVCDLIDATPDDRFWTLVQAFEAYYLTPGYDRHNGACSTYYICEVPCKDDSLEVREEIRRYSSHEATKKVVEVDDVEKSRRGAAAACDWLLDLADLLEYSPEASDRELVGDRRALVWRIESTGVGWIEPKW